MWEDKIQILDLKAIFFSLVNRSSVHRSLNIFDVAGVENKVIILLTANAWRETKAQRIIMILIRVPLSVAYQSNNTEN